MPGVGQEAVFEGGMNWCQTFDEPVTVPHCVQRRADGALVRQADQPDATVCQRWATGNFLQPREGRRIDTADSHDVFLKTRFAAQFHHFAEAPPRQNADSATQHLRVGQNVQREDDGGSGALQ